MYYLRNSYMIKKFYSPKIWFEPMFFAIICQSWQKKSVNVPKVGFWCRGKESNLHEVLPSRVFETRASAIPPPRLIGFNYTKEWTNNPHSASVVKYARDVFN